MMSEHMCRNSILPRSTGLSLRFQLAGYMQLVGWGTEQPGSSFGLILGVMLIVPRGNPRPTPGP